MHVCLFFSFFLSFVGASQQDALTHKLEGHMAAMWEGVNSCHGCTSVCAHLAAMATSQGSEVLRDDGPVARLPPPPAVGGAVR